MKYISSNEKEETATKIEDQDIKEVKKQGNKKQRVKKRSKDEKEKRGKSSFKKV